MHRERELSCGLSQCFLCGLRDLRGEFNLLRKYREAAAREEASMEGKTSAQTQTTKADIRSWLIVIGIAALFFIWGLFIYSSVGDKEPPDWDFGAVRDIPGESPYSTSSPKGFPGLTPPATQEESTVARQHVMGRSEESKPKFPESTPAGGAQ